MKKIYFAILKIIPVLIVFGAILFVPVCNHNLELANGNMTYMSCHYMMKMGMILGISMLVLTIEEFLYKKNFKILHIVLGVLLILITFKTVIFDGPCQNIMMQCHKTAWFFRVSGGLFLIAGFVPIIRNRTRVETL